MSSEYPPISEHGVIGNLETCALVTRDGAIDWCCLPDVDSPSVFASLLDAQRGGHFTVQPSARYSSTQSYVPATNVLETDFVVPGGEVRLTDWMPFPDPDRPDPTPSVIYRWLSCTEGSVELDATFAPRMQYGRERPRMGADGAVVHAAGDCAQLTLAGSPALSAGDGEASATFTLTDGDDAWFALAYGPAGPPDPAAVRRSYRRTIAAWREWVHTCESPGECLYGGRWHELVVRSELVLKLLIQYDTGAIAAAPTTSLPERVGGARNWDYRFNWLRDAALTVQALYKLGHVAEARNFFDWLLSRVYEDPASIRPVYGLHGRVDIPEQTLDHLEGYRESTPVRIGNAANGQRQLDTYGELVLAMYETSRYGVGITESNWTALREIVDYVARVWREPDAGIWEVRTEPRQFVYSKVMCWVALDRGIKIVERTANDFEGPAERWRVERERVKRAVLERGYDPEADAFVQTFGADGVLDATALLVPIVGFLPFDDPRVQGTIDAVQRELTTDEGLVYRYNGDDGLPGGEGTFLLCTFWLVDALALSGRVREARSLFDTVCEYASPLGLFAEEVAADGDRLLGNFPQGFSHLGLINSALYLDRVHENRQVGPEPLGIGPETPVGQPTPGDRGR
ncbi:MAG: glycoside hydrolase family 15 protein [Haloarculaceae archaeon]